MDRSGEGPTKAGEENQKENPNEKGARGEHGGANEPKPDADVKNNLPFYILVISSTWRSAA